MSSLATDVIPQIVWREMRNVSFVSYHNIMEFFCKYCLNSIGVILKFGRVAKKIFLLGINVSTYRDSQSLPFYFRDRTRQDSPRTFLE